MQNGENYTKTERERKEDGETDGIRKDCRKMTGSWKSNFPINSIANEMGAEQLESRLMLRQRCQ